MILVCFIKSIWVLLINSLSCNFCLFNFLFQKLEKKQTSSDFATKKN